MKKLITILLLGVVMLQATACAGDSGAGSADTTAANTDTDIAQTEAETTAAPVIEPDIPDVDYEGYPFKILFTDEIGSIRYSYEIDAETENGDVINDAVFKRNLKVMEKVNADIVGVNEPKAKFLSMFNNSVMAGDNTYDIVVDTHTNILKSAYQYGLDLSALKYIDLEKEWWDREVMEATALGGKIYGLSGDINIVDNSASWCLLFNKKLAKEYNVSDLYQIVRDGHWTIDKFDEIAKIIKRDVNGDGTYDHLDQWGFVGSTNYALSMLWSCGGMMGKLNSEYGIDITIDSETNISVFTKIYDLYQKDHIMNYEFIPTDKIDTTAAIYSRTMFKEDRAFLLGAVVSYCDQLRDMESDYGYLPSPKLSESQEKYTVTAQEWCATMFMAPLTAPDPERTSVILETMAAYSMELITPAYYNTALVRKLTRDDESAEMLDIIFDDRTFDIVFAYDFGSFRSTLIKAFKSESNIISSSIASALPAVKADYQAKYDAIVNK